MFREKGCDSADQPLFLLDLHSALHFSCHSLAVYQNFALLLLRRMRGLHQEHI